MAISDRGFAKMAREDPSRQRNIASMGGRASSGKFTTGKRAQELGRRGAAAQPLEAKRRGGQNSHRVS